MLICVEEHIDLEQLLAVEFNKDIYLLLLHKLMYKNIDFSTDFWQIQISKLEKVTRQQCSTHIYLYID